MSLVNDLLIETERRRGATGRRRGASAPAEELVPVRPRRRESRALERALVAFAVAGSIGAIAALVLLAKLGRDADPADADRATPPPVASRRVDAESDTPTPTPSSTSTTAELDPIAKTDDTTTVEAASTEAPTAGRTTSQRPVQVRSIGLERRPDTTQLRVVCDGRAGHRLERDDAQGRLELVLTGAALVEATEPLDLLATPIRSLDVRAEASDLHLVLTLDPGVRAQTRWLDVPSGAALVLDLQSPTPLAAAESPAAIEPSALPDPDGVPSSDVDHAGDASLDAEAEDDWASVEAPERDAADRVVSPALGDPTALRIERSERDRVRQERAATRAAIAEALAAARQARTEGRLEDADDRYAEVALLAPEDWTAVCEWADLLVARKRPDDALALVTRARQHAPRHQGLLITEARLLERKADLPGAIALLDGAGLALSEAPDVHALAAAYHQRAGDHAAAIERYEQLLRRFPEESRSWMGLGISLEAVGRREEARDVYRISLQVGELPRATRRWVGTRLVALGEGD